MDYGEVVPFTIAEQVLSLIIVWIGRVFISFIFAEVASYLASNYQTYNNHVDHKNRILKWVQLNNISPKIRKRIIRYFEFRWDNQKGIEETKLMKDLPRSLRVAVKNFIFDNLITNCEVFPTDSLGIVTTIISKL
jgi:cyclic nucleotide gated channel